MELKPSLTLFSMINLLGIAQALFFSALLFKLRRNYGNKAPLFLALFLLAYALVQVSDVMEDANFFFSWPHLSSVFPPLVFTLGPLIYLYVQALVKRNFEFKTLHLLHFLPFAALTVLLFPYYSLTAAEKIKMLAADLKNPGTGIYVSSVNESSIIS